MEAHGGPSAVMPLRVVIVDDHQVVGGGIKLSPQQERNLSKLEVARRAAAAAYLARHTRLPG